MPFLRASHLFLHELWNLTPIASCHCVHVIDFNSYDQVRAICWFMHYRMSCAHWVLVVVIDMQVQ